MSRRGFAGRTKNGKEIVLHHLAQNPAGPLIEMPRANNKISNPVQHPFGNTRGAGLSEAQRIAHDAWRNDYWRWRAKAELDTRRNLRR
jgi:A nuclease of the HNH/ENDO VII superfamily with conserved LHH